MSRDMKSTENEPAAEAETETPSLVLSSLGMPPYILDPADLPGAKDTVRDFRCRLQRVDDDTVVKYGPCVKMNEAEAMVFISEQTSVQCPTVIGAYVLDGLGYIIMTWVSGMCAYEFWETASRADRQKVIAQLQRYFKEMRSIEGDYVGGFNRTPCVTGEFMWDFDPEHKYGPYNDEVDFNEGFIDALYRRCPESAAISRDSEPDNKFYRKEIFTHGDINGTNLLIKPDGTAVIIDWECAGFYPQYWEWYKATWRGCEWSKFLMDTKNFIPPLRGRRCI